MTEQDLPTEYNEFVEFIESNDVSVVAQVLSENYTSNYELEAVLERANEAADYAAADGRWGESDGIIGTVSEIQSLLEE